MLRLALVFAVLATPLAAQTDCYAREHVVNILTGKFAETPTGRGLAANGHMIEVWTSEKGTWTVVITRPDGATCPIASGEAWSDIPREVIPGGVNG